MSTTVGSYLLDAPPDRTGWRGRGLDQRLDRPVEVTFLGALDAQTLSWLLAMAPAAATPRPEVATLTDLVFAGGGWYAFARPAGSDQNLGNLSGGSGLGLLAGVAATTARLHEEGLWHGAMGRWWRLMPGRAALAGLGYAWVLEPQRPLAWEQGFQADVRFLQGQVEGLATDGTIDRRVPAQLAALALRATDGTALRTVAREIAKSLQELATASGVAAPAPPPPVAAGPVRRTVQLSPAELAALSGRVDDLGALPASPPPPDEPPGPRPPTAYLPSGAGLPGAQAPLARTVMMAEGQMPPLPPPGGGAAPAASAAGPPSPRPASGGPTPPIVAGGSVPIGATVMMDDAPALARAGAPASAPPAAGKPAATPPPGMPALGARGQLVPSQETMIEPASVQKPAAPSPPTPPAARNSKRVMLVLVALGLLGLLAVGALAALWWYRRSATAPPADPVATAAPAAVAAGAFRVTAVPWAFAELVPAAGQTLPAALQGRRPTPLTGELPAGSWRVRLTHPAVEGERQCTLEVAAGSTAECREVMQTWTVDDYFTAVGWR